MGRPRICCELNKIEVKLLSNRGFSKNVVETISGIKFHLRPSLWSVFWLVVQAYPALISPQINNYSDDMVHQMANQVKKMFKGNNLSLISIKNEGYFLVVPDHCSYATQLEHFFSPSLRKMFEDHKMADAQIRQWMDFFVAASTDSRYKQFQVHRDLLFLIYTGHYSRSDIFELLQVRQPENLNKYVSNLNDQILKFNQLSSQHSLPLIEIIGRSDQTQFRTIASKKRVT